MTRKQRRLVLIGGGLGVLAVAVALMLNAFRDSIVFFNSPSDVAEKHVGPGTRIRLGGWSRTAASCAATICASASKSPTATARSR
jgi:cytochrome c-type biogenesis protein CcmE